MNYIPYKERKETYDDAIMTYLASRIFEEPKDSDQVVSGVADEIGQVVKPLTKDNYWALTDLDKFIKHLKSALGTKRLQKFITEYDHITDVDPLFIMNMTSKTPMDTIKTGLNEVISKVEDRSFLPEYINRKKPDFMESETELRKRASFALTVVNFLMYAFREQKLPTSIDFKTNIIPSVECTFNIRANNDYDVIKDYVIANQLADYNTITKEGIRLMVSCAKICEKNGLLNDTIKHPENYGSAFRRIAKI